MTRARRIAGAMAVVATAVLLPAASAGAAPVTDTVVSRGTSPPYTPDYPCLPPGGSLAYDFLDAFHITDFLNGVYHSGETQVGSATFTTAEGVVYSGSIATHQSVQSNPAPNQYTFTIALRFNLTADDGSRLSFTGVLHVVGTPTGEERAFELNLCPQA